MTVRNAPPPAPSATPISVRPARRSDREFVRETASRLSDFELPPWRTAGAVVAGERRTIEAFFRDGSEGAAMLVAEVNGAPLGFAFLETGLDYFDRRAHGHIGILAVAEASEGLGVGTALIAAAENWARRRGLEAITLNVFEGNGRARRLYERLGFRAETLRYRKEL